MEAGVRGMTIKGLNLTPHLVTDPVGLIAFGIGADLCCVWRRSHSMTAMNSPAERYIDFPTRS